MSEPARPLRLAIVGCGAAAERCHVPALPYAPELQLEALVDPVASHAQRLAGVYAALRTDPAHVRIVTQIREIVGTVDLAVVASPHRFHAPLAVELARAGIHCLVEKPLALTTDECDRMMIEADAHHVVLGTAFVRRLFPASVWIRNKMARGDLGVVRAIRWQEGSPYDWPLVSPSLFVPGLAGGGVVADGGSHILDLILWWLGADGPDTVAYRDTSAGGVESDAVIALEIGTVEVSIELSRLRLLRNTCVVEGTAATVEFGVDVDSPFVVRSPSGVVLEQGVVTATPPAQEQWERLFAEQLRNFAAATRGEEKIYADALDGRRVTALIQRCYAARVPVATPWREVAT